MELTKEYSLLQGDCLEVLKSLPSNSVQTCITSPPYYGLRDYGTGVWIGGDVNCPHFRQNKQGHSHLTGHAKMFDTGNAVGDSIYKKICPLCGAIRVDKQIGLEDTSEEYINRLIQIFDEVKRVLNNDGTLWLNIGDSYCQKTSNEAKAKDMYGIPWRLALALRDKGWYLRQDIIWAKTNPMPSSVKDRCVTSHEYIFLFSKNPNYYFDYKAIQEKATSYNPNRSDGHQIGGNKYAQGMYKCENGEPVTETPMRNKRDVWNIGVNTFKEAHFATFPEELISPCILAGSKEDDTILDIFNGSGTTGVVTLKNHRKYIGIDLNSEYLSMSDKRLKEAINDRGLF